METAQFCKCNNCGEVFIDTNPDRQPKFPITMDMRELDMLNDEGGCFKGCPTCKTDSYLMDIETVEQLK